MGYGIKNHTFILTRLLSHRVWNLLLIVFCVVLLFLGHGKENRLKKVRAVISTYMSPVLETISKPASFASEAVDDARKFVSLSEEVDRLKGENEKLRHLQTVALQNDIKLKQLQSFLNLKLDPRIRYITSRAIANVDSPYKDSISLNAGRKNGVAKGHAVIDQNGFLGQVSEVDESSSRVLLITDLNSRIPVRLDPGGVSAMLVGAQNNTAELKYFPFDYALKPDTKIYTSGEGALLPAGILIGHVVKKDEKSTVTLAANLKHINYVKILSLKMGYQYQVTQAVMKLPPLPQQQMAIRKKFSQAKGAKPHEQGAQTQSPDPASSGHAGLSQQALASTGHVPQDFGLLNLEKSRPAKKKTYRQNREPRFVSWRDRQRLRARYRQTYRDRYWRSRAFSGNLN